MVAVEDEADNDGDDRNDEEFDDASSTILSPFELSLKNHIYIWIKLTKY